MFQIFSFITFDQICSDVVEVGLGNVTNDKQVRNAASSFSTDFSSTSTPLATNKILTEAAAGSMRYTTLDDLPVSDDTQTAIDLKGSGTKRKMIYIEDMLQYDNYPICMVPVDCTITEVTAFCNTGLFTFQLEERAKGTPTTGGTDVFSSSQLGFTTMQTYTSFSNSGLAAETWLYFVCDSATSSPAKTFITVEYTED